MLCRAKGATEEFYAEWEHHRVEKKVAVGKFVVEQEKEKSELGHCTKGGKEKIDLRKILAFELVGLCV